MGIKEKFAKIHYDKTSKNYFLDFLSIFYAMGSKLKNDFYDKGLKKPKKVDAYVVSVGNLTTGGVGKTPVVAEIAKYYQQQGEKVAILSRGYGGRLSNKDVNVISNGETIFHNAEQSGDEPYWFAQNLKGIVVITCRNRYKAAKCAIRNYGVTKIILDDGFQHRKFHRDLDIVLIDSEKGFGNEKLLPAGPLREGKEAFKRIDKLVIVSKNKEHSRAEKYARIMAKKMSLPTFVCKTEPDYVYDVKSGEKLADGADVTAMCAIGQPEQFYNFLENFNIREKVTFSDHHIYKKSDLKKINGKIVTTEKDAVKLHNFDRKEIYALKLKLSLDVEALLNVEN